MATACGAYATAVVLSGGGHDGATGASAINHFGGTVLATSEATSRHFSMPHATIERDIALGHVVALDDMADRIGEIVDAPRL